MASDESASRRPVLVATLLMVGMTAACQFPEVTSGVWLFIGVVGIVVWAVWRVTPAPLYSRVGAAIALSGTLISLAAARMTIHADFVSASDIASYVTEREEFWRLEGRVRTRPVIKTPGGGSMSRFGYQSPLTYFQFEIDRAVGSRGDDLPLGGAVLARIGEPEYRLRVGDRLRLQGMLAKFPPARNPGELDRESLARIQGLAGVLDVKTRGNLRLLSPELTLAWRWRQWRAMVHERAAGWLLQDLPPTDTTRRDALLGALLLGDRGPGLDGLDKAFQRIGLAHLLSISGLHLTMLVLAASLVLRITNRSHVLEKLILIALIVGYLFVLPGRIPVWRAAVMALTFLVAGLSGRRIDPLNVLAWAAVLLLLWKPSELTAPGFQLSFGVVLALITLTEPLRRRIWGEPRDLERISSPEMIVEWMKTMFVATLVAWSTSLPLVAHHFGVICPFAWAMSLLALPLVFAILFAGYVKALTAIFFPSIGVVLAPVLHIFTDGLIGLVAHLDAMPWSSLVVGHPGAGWTVAGTGVIVWLILWRPQLGRRWIPAAAIALLAVTLVVPPVLARKSPFRPAVTITMLAVGDGSCYVIESDGEALIIDAGSGSYFAIGDAMVVPTLRRLGVLHVGAVLLSHADIDHFAATIEIIDGLGARELIVTPFMLHQAEEDPMSPVAWLFRQAEQRGVRVRSVARGHTMMLGAARLDWLHPEPDVHYRNDNESSAVIRMNAANRVALFTGDIERDSIDRLLEISPSDLRSDILELPHHGSWSEDAVRLVEAVNPSIVFQSTGWTRLEDDRWNEALTGRRRFTGPHDGMTRIRVGRNGEIESETWLESGRRRR